MIETIEIFGMLLRVEHDNGERHDCYGCAFFDGNGSCMATINGDWTPCHDTNGDQTRHFVRLIAKED